LAAALIDTILTGMWPSPERYSAGPPPGLHQRAGFRRVGTRQRIGSYHGRWRDVTLLERRSTITGT
jgi:phosphinothricin acetyltransferase